MSTYYTLITDTGRAKEAAALAAGSSVDLTHIAVGDGGGAQQTPDGSETALVNEVWRGALNILKVHDTNPAWLVAEIVIPTNVGGWTVREVGLIDADGDLYAIGTYPQTYKPQLAEGSGKDLLVRMILEVTSTASVTLKIDPAIVLASRAYVDESLADHGLPIGSILFNAVDGYTPPLCIPASGQELLRVDYPELWSAVEATAASETAWNSGLQGAFSTGDGATTFRVPLLDGEFLRALDRGAGVDAGRVHGSRQADEILEHNHDIWIYPNTGWTSGVTGGLVRNGASGSTAQSEAISDAGGAETRPRNVAYPVWIKYA